MTYEYACTQCGHQWEAEQSITAAPLTDCPNCGRAGAKRQVSGGQGFILKGGGWYADLYSSKKSAEGGAKTDAKGGETAKADGAAAAPAKEAPKEAAPAPAKAAPKADG